MWIDDSKITDWKIVKEMVVGGPEWIEFSKIEFSGETVPWDCDYDKELQIAYCDKLPDEERITDFILVVFVMMESILLFPRYRNIVIEKSLPWAFPFPFSSLSLL